ncbi:uncharacterized protein LOC103176787 [Callorhinchus milii]|uniref:uncharacterized protein LOC103176787 n=1 Tax=Callorhinchus milii TaxID=7868 RepID=UPI001C3F81FB|nr:uncharacterized protein LOC103176787 [Callorhinchus milii]
MGQQDMMWRFLLILTASSTIHTSTFTPVRYPELDLELPQHWGVEPIDTAIDFSGEDDDETGQQKDPDDEGEILMSEQFILRNASSSPFITTQLSHPVVGLPSKAQADEMLTINTFPQSSLVDPPSHKLTTQRTERPTPWPVVLLEGVAPAFTPNNAIAQQHPLSTSVHMQEEAPTNVQPPSFTRSHLMVNEGSRDISMATFRPVQTAVLLVAKSGSPPITTDQSLVVGQSSSFHPPGKIGPLGVTVSMATVSHHQPQRDIMELVVHSGSQQINTVGNESKKGGVTPQPPKSPLSDVSRYLSSHQSTHSYISPESGYDIHTYPADNATLTIQLLHKYTLVNDRTPDQRGTWGSFPTEMVSISPTARMQHLTMKGGRREVTDTAKVGSSTYFSAIGAQRQTSTPVYSLPTSTGKVRGQDTTNGLSLGMTWTQPTAPAVWLTTKGSNKPNGFVTERPLTEERKGTSSTLRPEETTTTNRPLTVNMETIKGPADNGGVTQASEGTATSRIVAATGKPGIHHTTMATITPSRQPGTSEKNVSTKGASNSSAGGSRSSPDSGYRSEWKRIVPVHGRNPGPTTANHSGEDEYRSRPCTWEGKCVSNRTSTGWNDMKRTLGFVWEMHVYGAGLLFVILMLISAINLIGSSILYVPDLGYLMAANALLFTLGLFRLCSCFLTHMAAPSKFPLNMVLHVLSVSYGALLIAAFFLAFRKLKKRSEATIEQMQKTTICNEESIELQHQERSLRCLLISIRIMAVSGVFGLLCCALQVYATLWLYEIVGERGLFYWSWWFLQFWYRSFELAMSFAMSFVASYAFCQPNGRPDHTCWNKIVQYFRQYRKTEVPDYPNNCYDWSTGTQERTTNNDITRNLIHNPPECMALRSLKESNNAKTKSFYTSGSITSLDYRPRIPVLGPKSHNIMMGRSFTSICIEKESMMSLNDFDLRPPSPINLSRSIDDALFREHIVRDSLFNSSGLYSPNYLAVKNSSCSLKEHIDQANDTLISSDFKRRTSDPDLLYSMARCSSISNVQEVGPDPLTYSQAGSRLQRTASGSSLDTLSKMSLGLHWNPWACDPSSNESVPPADPASEDLLSHNSRSHNPEIKVEAEVPDIEAQKSFIEIRVIDDLSMSSDTIEL